MVEQNRYAQLKKEDEKRRAISVLYKQKRLFFLDPSYFTSKTSLINAVLLPPSFTLALNC